MSEGWPKHRTQEILLPHNFEVIQCADEEKCGMEFSVIACPGIIVLDQLLNICPYCGGPTVMEEPTHD